MFRTVQAKNVFATVLLALFLNISPANAQYGLRPDETNKFFISALQAAGFQETVSLMVKTDIYEGVANLNTNKILFSNTFRSERILNLALILEDFGLIHYDMSESPEKILWSTNLPAWDSGDRQFKYVLVVKRLVDEPSIKESNWRSNHSDYKSFHFRYKMIIDLPLFRTIAPAADYEGLVLIKKHPAIDQWEFSSFDGKSTYFSDPLNESAINRALHAYFSQNEKRLIDKLLANYYEKQTDMVTDRFVRDGDIVTDSMNDLQIAVGQFVGNQFGGSQATYNRADEWCKSLRAGGLSDWKLPTRDELEMFVEGGDFVDTYDQRHFGDLASRRITIWTSSPSKSNPGHDVTWRVGEGFGETPSAGWAMSAVCIRRI